MLSKVAFAPLMAPQPVGTTGGLPPAATPKPNAPPVDATPKPPPAGSYGPSGPLSPTTPKPAPAADTRSRAGALTAGGTPADNSGLLGFGRQFLSNPGKAVGDTLTSAYNKADRAYAEGMNTPPLTRFTGGLGSFKGTADSILGAAQGFLKDHPDRTAGLVGGLLPSIAEPLLGTPFGAPALAGLHGLLAGGQSGAAAHTYFRPLLSKIGL